MIEIDAIVMIWSNKTSKFDLNLSLQKSYRLCKNFVDGFEKKCTGGLVVRGAICGPLIRKFLCYSEF